MKKLVICVLFILSLFLLACKNEDLNNDEVDALNALNNCRILYQDGDSESSVTKNITLSKPGDVKCEIEISNESVISKDGVVTRQADDVSVDVKFIVTVNEEKFEKTFKLTVKKVENNNQGNTGDTGDTGNTGEEGGVLSEADFTGLQQGATPIIEGWTLSVSTKGAYNTGWLSFRNDKENIVSDVLEAKGAIKVTFKYYMNNIGKNGNSSSKIKISVLDKDGKVLDEYLSNELNQLGEGEVSGNTNYAKTITAIFSAKGDIKVKVEFVKDGGGNIGFGYVSVVDMKLEG